MDRYVLKMIRERHESMRKEIVHHRLAARQECAVDHASSVIMDMLVRLRKAIGSIIIKVGIAIRGDYGMTMRSRMTKPDRIVS